MEPVSIENGLILYWMGVNNFTISKAYYKYITLLISPLLFIWFSCQENELSWNTNSTDIVYELRW